MPIQFGTDGWRAVISDEFTFANVRHVAQAIADHILDDSTERPSSPLVVIGFDTRFLSDRFAAEAARVLAGNGLRVYLSKCDCPTPAVSYAIRQLGATGGIMVTASHNPPRYNGIKYKAGFGGSAMPEETAQIEAHLQANLVAGREPIRANWTIESAFMPTQPNGAEITRFDLMPDYLNHIRSLINLDIIAQSGLRVLVDPMYGAGRGYIPTMLGDLGMSVDEIHGDMNPGFGGIHPEPIGRNLSDLIEAVQTGYDIGIATDGDADRIGAVDHLGNFVDPHTIIALALRHLVENRGMRGCVVKTVSTSEMVARLARRYGLPLYETPVGFNYICDHMLDKDVLIGGEESGGISIKGHLPVGDGILMGLLLLEIVAANGKSLRELADDLQRTVGPFQYARNDLRTKPFVKRDLVSALKARVPSHLGGVAVASVDDSDGIKYHLQDDSWLLIRPSGTEPVLRIYAEAPTAEMVQALLDEGKRMAQANL
jgi:alpha-D-glucose phosphate-specific phosphoglucomutase